jgi:hypothetical protein|eukprot:COSAG06_NODE_103_length_23904_cov_10.413401_9_plen_69_part_00
MSAFPVSVPSRACLGKMMVFLVQNGIAEDAFSYLCLVDACNRGFRSAWTSTFHEFSLCLSRACLGKKA